MHLLSTGERDKTPVLPEVGPFWEIHSSPLSPAFPPFSLLSFFITESLGLQGSPPATGPLSMDGMVQAGLEWSLNRRVSKVLCKATAVAAAV